MASHRRFALAYGVRDNLKQEMRQAGFDTGSLEQVIASWSFHRRADLWVIGFPPAEHVNASLEAILAKPPYCPHLLIVPSDDVERHFVAVSEHVRKYPDLVSVL